ncbi:hypothetical protein K8I31_22620 [bacterium]|nr:hypothetical protein [bacterium]
MNPDDLGKIYQNTEVSMEAFLSLGIGCIVLIVAIIYIHKRYMRYIKEREFLEEMQTLEMEQTESDTLFSLVRRYALNEPVDILYSQRLFDELAVKEISRVLGSPLSKENKTKFVNLIYNIRQKTYNQSFTPEMLVQSDQPKEEQSEKQPAESVPASS